MDDLRRAEFIERVDMIRADIREIHVRLDVMNGRTRLLEQDVAALKERTGGTARSAAIGSGVAAAVYGIVEIVRLLGGP